MVLGVWFWGDGFECMALGVWFGFGRMAFGHLGLGVWFWAYGLALGVWLLGGRFWAHGFWCMGLGVWFGFRRMVLGIWLQAYGFGRIALGV